MRANVLATVALAGVLAACSRDSAPTTPMRPAATATRADDDAQAAPVAEPEWIVPGVAVTPDNIRQLKRHAATALSEGRLYEDDGAAVPILLALQAAVPDDAEIDTAIAEALAALLAAGAAALEAIDEDPASLDRARDISSVARRMAPEDARVVAFAAQVGKAEHARRANIAGERALRKGDVGEEGGGAIESFRDALELRPDDARALQGLGAAESALIRRAEAAAQGDDYDDAQRWLEHAGRVRADTATVDDARGRIAAQRAARVRRLRDEGIAALVQPEGIEIARKQLAILLRIAPAGDPAAAELRERIDLAVHYGLFRPGQVFTDALLQGVGRGPQMVVVPHGAFRMGSAPEDRAGADAERPARNVRFERGFAMSRHEVTVGQFRRFVAATGYRSRASRRGYSIAYDERAGNLVRRGGVDWHADYAGAPAAEDLPVVHVSAKDAAAYAQWLSDQTGQKYRLPSEAEFEYALRAGEAARFPWGTGSPPAGSGNYTGALDSSPSGRRWRNAFAAYGDDAWGPAPVARYRANRYGLHDVAGNVAEWVADCWHDNYRRAPRNGEAWVNPGCRTRVVRGGSWASSPEQTRSAWRQSSDGDTTNARIGFRVVREI